MLILGHRGAPRRAHENTLDSLRAALEAGADGVETDVRMTADGALVVSHDDEAGAFAISTSDLSDLRTRAPALPSLDEALDVLGEAWTVLELKAQPGRTEAFAAAVADAVGPRAHQRTIVSSFDAGLLRLVRRLLPGVRTALTFWLPPGEDASPFVEEALDAGHAQLHPERRSVSEALVSAAASHGIELVSWTVNRAEQALAFRELGLAGVISDVPDELVALGPR